MKDQAYQTQVKKLALSGMLVAFTVALSGFSIPVGSSRCFPIQHLANILAGVFLGPVYGVSMAFCTSLIRNLLGTGSLFAFPGSMVGALFAACLYRKTGSFLWACLGELAGTGVIGALLCYPLAVFFMGREATWFFLMIPFLLSSGCGTLAAGILLEVLRRSGLLSYLNGAALRQPSLSDKEKSL